MDTVSISHDVEAMSFEDAVDEAVSEALKPVFGGISDEAALAIAKAFQVAAPGYPALVALASGVEVDMSDLQYEITYVYDNTLDPRDRVALGALGQWALDKVNS